MDYVEYVKGNPKLAQMKESTRCPGLFVLKYSRKVFYDNLWDDSLIEMRGRVVDAEGNTVINPFTKIFNRFENKTDIDRDELCLAVEKVNGFMAAMTYVPAIDKVVISTTGSLDSDFVDIAAKHLDYLKEKVREHSIVGTYLFEIVDESDPHIIKEKAGAYLLGFRRLDQKVYFSSPYNEMVYDAIATDWGVRRPKWFKGRFSEVVVKAREAMHEGYVVYGLDSGKSLKIKSPYYLTTKFLARIGADKLVDKLKNKTELKKTIDEEFYDLIDFVDEYIDIFKMLDDQGRIIMIENFLRGEKKCQC